MQEHDMSWVRTEMMLAQPAPAGVTGLGAWVRKNLIASTGDTIMTIIGIALVVMILPQIINWAFVNAVWAGPNRTVCATLAQGGIQPDGWSGACWAFVNAKFGQFMFGTYPIEERWRPILVGILLVVLMVPMLVPSVPRKGLNALLLIVGLPVVAFFLLVGGVSIDFGDPSLRIVSGFFDSRLAVGMQLFLSALMSQWVGNVILLVLFLLIVSPFLLKRITRVELAFLPAALAIVFILYFSYYGGQFSLPHVETARWGGLLVTLSLSFVAIVVSLPLGIVLALGRRSKMPIVKMLCVIFIEAVRGIPLITVLFMASVMLPLFLPPGVTFDKYLRALIGVSLFAAAYMAEVVRGGLQAIPKGQYEGADSLGLGYWQKMYFIVMPQALKLVIPGIVNTFIGMFKDTSLVTIISMFDLLGIVKQNFSDANWASAQTAKSGLIFAAFVFWLFCFGMSRYSMFTERRLDTGHKR